MIACFSHASNISPGTAGFIGSFHILPSFLLHPLLGSFALLVTSQVELIASAVRSAAEQIAWEICHFVFAISSISLEVLPSHCYFERLSGKAGKEIDLASCHRDRGHPESPRLR
jgi:hypothetical protein